MKLDKLTEATILALRGKLNESTNSVLDKNEIAEFLKEAITDLTTTDYTCSWYTLDKDLAIFVGWTEGYDADDPDYIHAKDDPTFVIAAKIASTHEYMKTDLDWLVQPYNEDGEVWDTEITLNNNRNFTEDADWFIKSYKGIREALDRGELLLENKKQEARSHKEDNERVAPRNIDKLDVSLGSVGNFAPKNSTGDKYTGTTEADYRSKRNRTGRKNDDGVDEYITYNNHYDTAVPTYQDFKWNADEFEKEANKYKNDKRGQYATKMMISHQKEADKVVDRVRERVANRKEEARSHKEDNEKVAPRTTIRNGKEVKITDIQKDLDNTFVGKRYAKGAVANNPYYGGQYYGTTDGEYRSKRNKTGQKRTSDIDMSKKYDVYKADTFETPVTDYQSAMNRYKSYEETGDEDVPIAQSYKKSAQDIVNKERERIANKSTENKKVTEASTDVNEVIDDYKKAYGKDLDMKRVPCVIARDKMLSGWGGAEGRNHYQVVLCADSTEAHNIASNMQAQAKREQLANVRVSFGVKLPSRASVAYCVGRNASAWNMSDSWYERYDTEKKTEAIDENLKTYTVTVSDEENQHSFQFYAEKDKTLDDVFNEIYDYVIF